MNSSDKISNLSRGQRTALVAVVTVLAAAIGLAAAQRLQDKRDPAPPRERPAPAVEVVEVAPAPFVLTRTYRGSVAADNRAVVSARITARVLEIHHREGAVVAAGEPLIRLDDEELRREADRLEAVGQRLAGEFEVATRQLARDRELHAEHMIPERSLDESVQRAQGLEAQQRENRAALALVNTRLGYSIERAPFDGIVQRNHVQAGELAALGQPLIELVSTADLKAVIAVPQADASLIAPGQPVELEVAALRERWSGTVDRVYPALDESTRNATVAAFFPPAAPVRPGMAVTAQVELERLGDVLSVPAHAVHREAADTWVWLFDAGVARRQAVRAGATRHGVTLIEDGLSTGAPVIVTADRRLADGGPVSRPAGREAGPSDD